MPINMDDREYYRGFEDRQLIEQAHFKPTAELAIVLAERLNERPEPVEEDQDPST